MSIEPSILTTDNVVLKQSNWKDESGLKSSSDLPYDTKWATLDVTIDGGSGFSAKGTERVAFVTSTDDKSLVEYCGHTLLNATIDGKKGTFVCRVQGSTNASGTYADWKVITDSATGDLKGISGEGKYYQDLDDGKDVKGEFNLSF